MMKSIYIHGHPILTTYLVEEIKRRKWDKQKYGLEMDSHYFTAFCYEKIKTGLPDAKLKDSKRLVNWVRFIKSDTEIDLMRTASRITEKGMKTAFENINPGVRQCDASC